MEKEVFIHLPELNKTLPALQGETVLHALQRCGIAAPAHCGGHGTCGRCKIEVDGRTALACETTATQGMVITMLWQQDEEFSILAQYPNMASTGGAADGELGIAIDIGTTTVAVQLLSLDTGDALTTCSFVNPQRFYGADVITRIQAVGEGKLHVMQNLIATAIVSAIEELCVQANTKPEQVRRVCVAGNTTMIYLLLGLPCQSLGQAPFVPEYSLEETYSFAQVFHSSLLDCRVDILPWISAFIGGDIVAGILFCRKNPMERSLLVDMGTNGEIALCVDGQILCTSTAAGPAFEGGNITCGTGSIAGAIAEVDHGAEGFCCKTIGGKPPVGICGSGVLDAAACLIQHGFADETGCLADEFFNSGVPLALMENGKTISFTQQDIRELQLAKSAIRAGIEVLLAEKKLEFSQLHWVYLSGGLGQNLSLSSAVAVGLLPQGLENRVVACGNSALGGCALACYNPHMLVQAKRLAEEAQEVNLSNHSLFNSYFMEYMSFPQRD